jgi:hypothetical protein
LYVGDIADERPPLFATKAKTAGRNVRRFYETRTGLKRAARLENVRGDAMAAGMAGRSMEMA